MSYHARGLAQFQTVKDPNSHVVYGESVVSGGLNVRHGISGAGLISKGFIWEGYEIYLWPQDASPIVTGWTAAAGYSGSATLIATGWTAAAGYSGCAAASLISTTWAVSSNFGNEFPS